ncbi:site-2 protease family protein [Calidifontibacter sp. DB0510]|uniref:Site-2 protease family protein n=1 Tax=Metallococcus carri TaxID=1656884 RepID=A0A967EFU1_9MICO|nr:M50 family metallopeptidase [Metallococcus carri]NHN54303.1 site-2 protease family protein [Metallococcus carri]NOP36857.1 site-2 protease family protein [Calidifontibacter sp. DB2511S]
MFLLGVLLIAIGVALSIALHEIGHLVPAKKFGVKVTQYMIGFGPTLWSRRRGETEYGLKAIPLGGYIRMIGMFPPRAGEERADGTIRVRASSTGRFSQMADQVRDESYEEIGPQDSGRVFYKLKSWQKVVVMFGGPFMNLVIATVLLTVIACGFGLPKEVNAKVASVVACLPAADGSSPKSCAGQAQTPAARAGLAAGDVIVSVAGVPVRSSSDATTQIRAHANQAVPMVIERGGQRRTLTLTPVLRTMPKLDSSGIPVTAWDGTPETVRVGVIGAGIGADTVTERQSITAVPGMVGGATWKTASVVLDIPRKMVGVAHAAFGSGQRDANGPMSVVGVGRIAGDVAQARQISLADRFVILLSILASLNLALFVFNLVPLLPLDGGHIAGAIVEAIKRPIMRARGVKGPVYVDVAKALPVAYGVSLLLVVMFGLLMYADIVNPVKL